MNPTTIIFLINKKVRAMACTYEGGDKPVTTIFKTLDPSIQKDDLVSVPTRTRVGFTVVKVVEPDVDFDLETTQEVLWIVDKVDLQRYQELLGQEEQAVQAVRAAELRAKREKLAKELLATHVEDIKTLAIADMNGGAEKND